ncbi:MAG: YecA family protein [Candidatus Binatia bacterium]
MPRNSRLRIVADAPAEWAGARIAAPFEIGGEGPSYFPDVSMWLELPSGIVLATKVHGRGRNDGGLAGLLEEAMARPLAGRPRVPPAVRVPTRDDAARVLEFLPEGVAVRVAPVPEIARVVGQMSGHMATAGPELGWLTDGRIARDDLGALFQAARTLYLLAPWRTIGDTNVVRVDVPALGVDGACLSFIGQLGETLGFLLFASIDDFDDFIGAALEIDAGGEAPIEIAAGCLSLTYERVAGLPPDLRRKAKSEQWAVAGPKAFPYLERRGEDGQVTPLEERDVRLATVLIGALAAFVARHRENLEYEESGPICESFDSGGGTTVTLTYPYEDHSLFFGDDGDLEGDGSLQSLPSGASVAPVALRGPSAPPLSPPRLAKPAPGPGPRAGRNDPCPCGSGKKYKKCHLASDERAAAPAAQTVDPSPDTDALHVLDRGLLADLDTFARQRFGKKWLRYQRDFVDAEEAPSLAPHWSLYHFCVDAKPVVEWYEEAHGRALSAAQRRWLAAQRAAWLTVWEIQAVIPGRSIKLLDVLTGQSRIVVEKSASRIVTPRLLILARVVEHGEVAVIAGMHPQPLRPMEAEPVLEAARARARRRDLIPLERLRTDGMGRLLIRSWEEQVAQMHRAAATPPVLHNTDGDKLRLTVDTYDVEPAAMRELERRLEAIDGVVEIEEHGDLERSAFTLERKARSGSGLDHVTIARISLSDSGCTLEAATNSVARGDEVRKLLQPALRGLAKFRDRQHPPGNPFGATAPGRRDAAAAAGRGNEGASTQPPEPGGHEVLRQFKQRHYEGWIDEALPALDGLTPRQAAGSAKHLRRLEVLLRDMESHELGLPAAERYDFAQIRHRLGMGS